VATKLKKFTSKSSKLHTEILITFKYGSINNEITTIAEILACLKFISIVLVEKAINLFKWSNVGDGSPAIIQCHIIKYNKNSNTE